jgi:hypothetical protein
MFRRLLQRRALTYGAGIGLALLVIVPTTVYEATLGTPHAAAKHNIGQISAGLELPGPTAQGRPAPAVVAKGRDAKTAAETTTTTFGKVSPGTTQAYVPGTTQPYIPGTTQATPGPARAHTSHPGGTTPTTTIPPKKKVVVSCKYQYAGTSLAGFIAAAEQVFPATECLSSPGRSLAASSTAQITRRAALNFEGATVTGTSSLGGPMLSVGGDAATTSISEVLLDEGSGSGNGINCDAACTITASTVEGMRGNGIFVSGPGSDGSVIGGTSWTTRVATVGSLFSGLMFNHDSDVRVGYVTSSFDNHNGVFFNFVSAPCSASSISVTDLGQPTSAWRLSKNDSGGGLTLTRTGTTRGTGCSFTSVSDSGNGGYGVNVEAASWNTFTYIAVTGESTGELNSGINVSSGSADNTFSTANVHHEATAVDIGSNGVKGGNGEAGNNYNSFGTLLVSGDSYGSVSITGGQDNVFTSIIGTNEGNDGTGSSFYLGLIQFQYQSGDHTCNGDTTACPVSGNVVHSAYFSGPPDLPSWDTAHYIIYANVGASDNYVTVSRPSSQTYKDAACDDSGHANHFSC